MPLFPSWPMSSPGRDRVSRHHCVSVIRTGAPGSPLPFPLPSPIYHGSTEHKAFPNPLPPTPSGFEYFSLCLFFNSLTIWYLECGFLSVYTILDKLNFLNPWAGLFHGFRKILDQDLSIAFALRLTSVFLGL